MTCQRSPSEWYKYGTPKPRARFPMRLNHGKTCSRRKIGDTISPSVYAMSSEIQSAPMFSCSAITSKML